MSTEQALEAFYRALAEDDAEQLYERAPCGYLSTTPDGLIIKVNETLLNLTGHARDDLLGRPLTFLLTAGGRIYHETHYAPMLRMQGSAPEIALDIVRADGSRLPALLNAVMEHDEDGEPRVVRIAVFDATDRREYERELLRAKQRAEESERQARDLARTLQQTLIPPTAPVIEGLEVASAYRPAGSGEEVGGDFYDVFQLAEGEWVVAIGDVCGKGVDAAVVTALARYTIRAAAVRHDDPAAVLHALNDVLLLHDTDRFCTVALARLRQTAGGWSAVVSCGGHPLPLLVRGEKVEPVGAAGSLLGMLDDPFFHEAPVELGPGDAVLLYTDGVIEGRDDSRFFGEAGLRDSIASVPVDSRTAASLTDRVLADVLVFQGDAPKDDIAVVTLRVP